jgi:hypothetical protein
VLAFLSGFVGSLLGTRLVEEIAWHHRWHAVLLEAATVGVGIVGWQIWARRDQDWRVLAMEGAGAVLATFVILSL